MDTIYNVGDVIYHEAIIDEINIDKNEILYKIIFKNAYKKTCEVWVRIDDLRSNISISKYQEDMLKEGQLNAET